MTRRDSEFPALQQGMDFVFIHVPKTGGMSIAKQIRAVVGRYRDGHHAARDYIDKNGPGFFDRIPAYAVIRNPLDQLVSAYYYGVGRFRAMGGDCETRILTRYASFPEFCHAIPAIIEDLRKMAMFRPQQSFIVNTAGEVVVEPWLFDQLPQFSEMLATRHLGVENSLPLVNPSHHQHYTQLYTPRMISIVQEHWREDFILYEALLAQALQATCRKDARKLV